MMTTIEPVLVCTYDQRKRRLTHLEVDSELGTVTGRDGHGRLVTLDLGDVAHMHLALNHRGRPRKLDCRPIRSR